MFTRVFFAAILAGIAAGLVLASGNYESVFLFATKLNLRT